MMQIGYEWKNRIAAVAALLVILIGMAAAQTGEERRLVKDYTSPDEIVSIAQTTPLDQALSILSVLSKKFSGKVIIDPDTHRTAIGVDIQGLPWRTALETILRKNLMWYEEFKDYIRVFPLSKEQRAEAGLGGDQAGSGSTAADLPTFESREVRISAVFLEADIGKLNEAGVSWDFYRQGFENDKVDAVASFGGSSAVSNNIFAVTLGSTPNLTFGSIDAIIKFFESNSLGEILASPELTVRSGVNGKIQIGQDFSTKMRDFSGNTIDRFYQTGSIIDVTPTVIHHDTTDFIHLKIHVERSSVQPDPVTILINKTVAETQALILNGEEVAIGGLIDRVESHSRVGIPILKDLPWWFLGLRYLFGYDQTNIAKKELVLLLHADLVPTLAERMKALKSGKQEDVMQKKRLEHDQDIKRWRGEQ